MLTLKADTNITLHTVKGNILTFKPGTVFFFAVPISVEGVPGVLVAPRYQKPKFFVHGGIIPLLTNLKGTEEWKIFNGSNVVDLQDIKKVLWAFTTADDKIAAAACGLYLKTLQDKDKEAFKTVLDKYDIKEE